MEASGPAGSPVTNAEENLRRVLADRSEAVVGAWYGKLRSFAVAFRSPAEVRSHLWSVWDDVVAFLLEDAALPVEAEPIGARFVPLRLRSGAPGQIVWVLSTCLTEDLPRDVEPVLRARLPDLIQGLLTGLVRAAEESLLQEQEEIREAYARSLRKAEEELRIRHAGIESSINAIAMLDLEGAIIYVNPAFLQMWGYEGDHEVLGAHVSRFGEWQVDISRTLQILTQQGGWVGELTAVRADGSRFAVQASVSAIPDAAGHTVRLMGFFVDITERKRTQEALRQRAVQAAFLNEIGEEIAGQRTAEGVLTRAVELAQETFGFRQVSVFLLDHEKKALVEGAVASPCGSSVDGGCSVQLGEGIAGWVAQQRTEMADDAFRELVDTHVSSRSGTMDSVLTVPISRGGRPIGVLRVQSPVEQALGGSERVVLETLADQIAVALENAQLYHAFEAELAQRRMAEEALRTSVQRLETVHEIDQAILGAESKEEVGEAILRNVRRLVPCERASIDLFDFEASEVVVIAAVQTIGEGRAGAGTRFPLTLRQMLFEMLGRHQVAYVKNLRRLPQSSPLIKTLCSEGIRSALVGPVTARGELIGMLSLGSQNLAGFEAHHKPIVRELADTAGIAIQQARLFDSIRRQRERLRRTMARLAEVEETERRRVVRELHDQVGQNLTALDLNLSLVRSQLERHGLKDLAARLSDSLSLVEQTNRRIRRLMVDLRPPVLDDYGLLSALHWYGDRFSGRTGITVSVRGSEEVVRDLSPHVENALFRIAQEALNNTAKHACAERVMIALASEAEGIRLTIGDDGVGFDPEILESERQTWGLLTMRERAESVGAQCRFDAIPEGGTRVVVTVPR